MDARGFLQEAFQDPRRYALQKRLEAENKKRFKRNVFFYKKVGSVFLFYLMMELLFSVCTLRWRWKRLDAAKVKRVLLLKVDHIGDVVLMTPALCALKQKFPHARVDVVLGPWAKDVLNNNPQINAIFRYHDKWQDRGYAQRSLREKARIVVQNLRVYLKLIFRRYDVAINFRGDYNSIFLVYMTGAVQRIAHDHLTLYSFLLTQKVKYDGALHEAERHLALLHPLGIEGKETQQQVYPAKEDYAFIDEMLRASGLSVQEKYVGIRPGALYPLKQWPLENFAMLINDLVKRKERVLLIGGPGEEELVNGLGKKTANVNVLMMPSVLKFAALTSHLKLLVCNDGGPMHVAAAMQTPLLALYGPTPMSFRPLGAKSVVLRKEAPCSPCPVFVPKEKNDCPEPLCMKSISPQEVMGKVSEVLYGS